MGDLPLRTPTHRRIGGPSHRQLPNAPHGHPFPARRPFLPRRCLPDIYAVLDGVSADYPPGKGRFHTCYSPVRRSPAESANTLPAAPRLACVKPVASVHPEPGSNSSLLLSFQISFFSNLSSPSRILQMWTAAQRMPRSIVSGRLLLLEGGPGIDGKLISFPLSHLSCC